MLAMASPISITDTLQNGFWPSSRFGPSVEDEIQDDSIIHEKYAEDAQFVGCRCNRPVPLFCIGDDVYARYFHAVLLINGDLHPF
jgi:hypothetical protein